MHARRTSSMLAAALIATAMSSAATADALSMAEGGSATSAPDKLACGTEVIGVTNDGKLLLRELSNDTIDQEKASTRALPFKPKAMALAWFEDTAHGYKLGIRTINPHGSPTILTVTQLDRQDTVTYTSDKMLNRTFKPQAFAGSGGFHVFTSTRGVVKRWTSYRNRHGRLFYDDPVVAAKGAPTLKTLSFSVRKKVNGVQSDVLWGTTSGGALVQVRVPVDHPDRAKVIIVKQHGFRGASGLSLSFCGGHASTLSIVAISKTHNKATWYTLTDQFSPRAKNLTKRGPAGAGANWHLSATF